MTKNKLSDIAKKIDLDAIVKNVKSIIKPTANTPDVDPNDPVGVKLASISVLVQSVANIQAQQSKDLAKINKLVNALYEEIEASREADAEEEASEDKSTDK
ncbi:MAG: hypothetical protein COB66_00225 [Coxiella sp. (in: Bacteria)]|nr:MAG: hypothetical protein COB66_00225 [Coxiella sp. (in: g-proteobacteria)]